jgi:hypothetical protein
MNRQVNAYRHMKLGLLIWLAFTGSAGANVTLSQASPQSTTIKPFGYGTVRQQLVLAANKTGANWCAAWWGPGFQCASVSGGNSCSATVPIGEVVSCNPAGTPPVNETAFQTISCNGQPTGPIGPLGSDDWCLIANLEPTRTQDTVYLYSDWVRVGLNRRFGGAVFELYGTDEQNRIMQNGGGALQLSLWAETTGYAPQNIPRAYFQVPQAPQSCNATAFSTEAACEAGNASCQLGVEADNQSDCSAQFSCGDNGTGAGGPVNPIQAISAGCGYGQTQYSNNEAYISGMFSSQPNVLTAIKQGPQQFTKSTNAQVAGLTWTETGHVDGPFAMLSYNLEYTGTTQWNSDFQEIPSLFTHQGYDQGYVYYYSGTNPYQNPSSTVTQATRSDGDNSVQVYQLPGRSGPFGTGVPQGYGANLTEDWVTLCDGAGQHCITLASFAPDAQDIIYIPGDASYFGIHGFFALTPNMNKTITVWVAPYRWDAVVNGMTVRQWIYQMHQGHSLDEIGGNTIVLPTSDYFPRNKTVRYQTGAAGGPQH